MPRLLVVVLIPTAETEWHDQSETELVVRHCAYWMSLQGRGPNEGKGDKVTVQLPRANVFSVEGLRQLMRRAATKEPL